MSLPAVNELNDRTRFELLAELGHKEIAPFVAEYYWRRKSVITFIHYSFSLVILAAWVFVGIQQHRSFDSWMTNFGNAVLSAILLLPVHELIHGIVYKSFGARDVRYGISLRKFYAYAIAHRFVAGQVAFALVAIAPFFIINSLLILAVLLFPHFVFYLLAVLIVHTAGTSGDFAMLNFLWLHRRREIYTYDDADEHRSCFFGRL